MMTLWANNKELKADSVVKVGSDIFGYDEFGNVIFSFKGISDFVGFQLEDENGGLIDFPSQEPTDIENLENYLLEVDMRLVMIELGI